MGRESHNTAAAFGQRLREAMRAKGHSSDTARSGVDVGALADAAGTSYEMARRYAEGMAAPRPDTLGRIAAWLGVAPAVLAWGVQGESESTINAEVLQQCITAVNEAQARTGGMLEPQRAAKLIAMLYLEAIDGRAPAAATVVRMIQAMG